MAASGDLQLGGRKDGRYQVIEAWETTSCRREMNLPTVDVLVDAKHGYDGGRHGQFLKAAKRSRIRPREWLLLHALLKKARVHLRRKHENGTSAIIGPLPNVGGSTVQGLSISGDVYGALPLQAAAMVAAGVPEPATVVHPSLQKAYHETCDQMSVAGDVDMGDLIIKADVVSAILSREGDSESVARHTHILEIFRSCSSDAERLLLLDMTALESGAASHLFVDDGRFRSSCGTAAAMIADCLTEYTVTHGVVFPAGPNEKGGIVCDNLDQPNCEQVQALMENRIQGATPNVVPTADHLGAPFGLNQKTGPRLPPSCADDADLILRKVERRGAVATRTVVVRAKADYWPLVARRFYLKRAACRIAYLAPLTIPAPTAGKRITNLQVRWAIAALRGETPRTTCGEISKPSRWTLLNDLGWTSLWATTLAAAMSIYQGMRNGDETCSYARAAKRDGPAVGSWVHVVRRTKLKYRIPDMEKTDVRESGDAFKKRLKAYRRNVVLPAITKKLEEGRPTQPALPWGWIAKAALPKLGFERWWHIRCLQEWPSPTPDVCPLCRVAEAPTWDHLVRCRRMMTTALKMGCKVEQCFDYPSRPQALRIVVEALDTELL